MRRRLSVVVAASLFTLLIVAAYLWSSSDFRGRRMYDAFRDGHTRLGRLMVHLGADPNYGSGSSSPMHLAAARGDVELMRFLVEHGAEVDRPVKWNVSPLHEARRCRQLEAERFLLAHGADPDRRAQSPP